jgi:hypothetical protein
MKSIILPFLLVFGILLSVSIAGCSKSNEDAINCTLQVNPVILTFNILDKLTKEDLYFSPNPRFKIKDIYFFKKKDVSRRDTLRPTINGSGTDRTFQYTTEYNTLKDTLTMKMGGLSDDSLTYTIETTNNPCTNYRLSNVTFNGSIISPTFDKYNLYK